MVIYKVTCNMKKSFFLTNKMKRQSRQVWTAIKTFPAYRTEFGPSPAVTMLRRNASLISVEDYIQAMSAYVMKELTSVTKRYLGGVIPSFEKKTHFDKKPIWVCWFQGKENLPELCRACVEQMKKTHPQNAELVFLTNANYKDYIGFPDYINEKYEAGLISAANFSDVLRYGLLSTYGGVWVDAAILLTGNTLQRAVDSNIFTVRFYEKNEKLLDASRGKWIGGFWAGTDEVLTFKYCYESLLHLWSKHDLAIEYLACDYIIWSAYSQIESIREEIDSIPVNNKNIRLLNLSLNEKYSAEKMKAILESNDVHLINRHLEYMTETNKGEPTIYGHLIRYGVQ